ncbi:L-threonylcarbamoyladenylate synthase [Neorhodopirellula pilleata]|uniref:Threonylcarbamoyl-AMP synthase n=1 Tax=Neorhodopirellula pilleata TaxID=2714738 RepID=A0A5C6A9J9_9BACT|nr:L-threonylcarbamoyladenylate synthase [Neorhodopirellula pilleata]TWT95721.1 Threonylcarbamoyl-AMP synthase [Neorhodopirellula pilleata]
MHPKIYSANPSAIARAAEALLSGELVGLPTETVYGLAARGDDARAVESIFVAKGRPRQNPLILHVAHPDDARRLLADDLSAIQSRRLLCLQAFWPGPLTLIAPKHPAVLDAVTAGGDTVAVRVPDHPIALAVLREMDRQNGGPVPLAAPSANVSNYVSPTTAEHVADGLGEHVAMILDGGDCLVGIESTIVYLGTDELAPRILRSGRISELDLVARLDEPLAAHLEPQPHPAPERYEEPMIAAPGQFAKHYSPRAEVILLPAHGGNATGPVPHHDPTTLRIGFHSMADSDAAGVPCSDDRVWTFAPDGRLETAASNLYRVLRLADQQHFQRIEIVGCGEEGIGVAIMDRLRRAAGRD